MLLHQAAQSSSVLYLELAIRNSVIREFSRILHVRELLIGIGNVFVDVGVDRLAVC